MKRLFDKFPKYDMKSLLRDFSAKVDREDIFKPAIGNENLYEISNDNGVIILKPQSQKYDVPTWQHP
jgi:hypothetical protein